VINVLHLLVLAQPLFAGSHQDFKVSHQEPSQLGGPVGCDAFFETKEQIERE
jgi:hypothetical protein